MASAKRFDGRRLLRLVDESLLDEGVSCGGSGLLRQLLTAPVSLVDPLIGFVGIKAFAAAIVGGFGSLPGAILGGLLIGIVEQFAGLYLPPGFAETSAYLLLLVMLFVRPQGLFATMAQKKV